MFPAGRAPLRCLAGDLYGLGGPRVNPGLTHRGGLTREPSRKLDHGVNPKVDSTNEKEVTSVQLRLHTYVYAYIDIRVNT